MGWGGQGHLSPALFSQQLRINRTHVKRKRESARARAHARENKSARGQEEDIEGERVSEGVREEVV